MTPTAPAAAAIREELSESARAARRAHTAGISARDALADAGFRQIRIDRFEHPKTRMLVEYGHTYGESRLTVANADGKLIRDYRFIGQESQDGELDEFRRLITLVS